MKDYYYCFPSYSSTAWAPADVAGLVGPHPSPQCHEFSCTFSRQFPEAEVPACHASSHSFAWELFVAPKELSPGRCNLQCGRGKAPEGQTRREGRGCSVLLPSGANTQRHVPFSTGPRQAWGPRTHSSGGLLSVLFFTVTLPYLTCTTFLLVFPGINSQINYLHPNCDRVIVSDIENIVKEFWIENKTY